MEIVLEKKIEVNETLYTLVFYREPGDCKCRFKIKNKPDLTNQLLMAVKNKRIKVESLYFAIKGIRQKLSELLDFEENILPLERFLSRGYSNPMADLSLICQRKWRANVESRVVGVSGCAHRPTVRVELKLPNGDIVRATGANQREARNLAAIKAFTKIHNANLQ